MVVERKEGAVVVLSESSVRMCSVIIKLASSSAVHSLDKS